MKNETIEIYNIKHFSKKKYQKNKRNFIPTLYTHYTHIKFMLKSTL